MYTHSLDYTNNMFAIIMYNSKLKSAKKNQTICIDQASDLGRFIINFKGN